jgi:hypothetical protein
MTHNGRKHQIDETERVELTPDSDIAFVVAVKDDDVVKLQQMANELSLTCSEAAEMLVAQGLAARAGARS